MAKLKYKNKGKGVPVNYREVWGYKGVWNEKKLRKGLWAFRFRASKRRKARGYGSFGRGTKGRWKINAIQDIVKTGKGKYQTLMRGFKRPVYFSVRRPKKSY